LTAHIAGDRVTARQLYERAMAIDPDVYRVQFLLGTIEIEEGNLDKAMEHLDQACAIGKKAADAYNSRGVVKWRQGNRRGALRDFSRAVTIDPEFELARTNRGIARLLDSNYDAARSDFEKSIAGMNPNYIAGRATMGLGVLEARAGNLRRAEALFDNVASAQIAEDRREQARYNRDRVREKLGVTAGAPRASQPAPVEPERSAPPDATEE
jgi:tetratricopeptide (TPR) repeat protein